MKPIRIETVIAAPPAHVFGLFTDLAGAPGRIRAIRKLELLTPGPVGKGTRFRETRAMFGKESSETMEILSFEPGRSYSVGAQSCGTRYLTSFDFEPAASGTRVRMSFQGTPVSFAARLLAPLFGFMAGSVRKAIEGDMTDMKAACEGGG
jgi:uncharacterized protein YndB with AHSA1/START domain